MITKYKTGLGPGSRCHFSKQVPKRSPEHLPRPSQMLPCPTSHISPHQGPLSSSIPQGVWGWGEGSLHLAFPAAPLLTVQSWGGAREARGAAVGLGLVEEGSGTERGPAAHSSCQPPPAGTGPGPALVLNALGSSNSTVRREKPKQTNKQH